MEGPAKSAAGASGAGADLVQLARERLGERSALVLCEPALPALAVRRAQAGANREDAVLAAIFERASSDRELADEFLRCVLVSPAGGWMRAPPLAPALARLADEDDLVQSVLGDLWRELGLLRFESRAQFRALVAQRLCWKAADHAKRARRLRRRDDLRVEPSPEELGVRAPDPSPLSELALREEARRLALAVARLPERDRRLLRLHLRGERIEVLALACGLSRAAAVRALQRARHRLHALAERVPARARTEERGGERA